MHMVLNKDSVSASIIEIWTPEQFPTDIPYILSQI